jgi:hypothetical protein
MGCSAKNAEAGAPVPDRAGHEVPPVLSPDERDTYDVVVRKGKFSASGYRLIVAGMLAGG